MKIKTLNEFLILLICFFAGFIPVDLSAVHPGFNDVKFLSLIFAGTVLGKRFPLSRFVKRRFALVFFAGILTALISRQAENPGSNASVMAKSTEQTLSVSKTDSLIKAYAAKSELKAKADEDGTMKERRLGFFALFLLGMILSFVFFVLIFSWAWAGMVSVFGAFILTFFDLGVLSWGIHNLVKAVRKRSPQKHKEMSREDFKRERGIFFRIYLSVIVAILAFLLIIGLV